MALAALAGGCSGGGDPTETTSSVPRSSRSSDAENRQSPGTLTGRLLYIGGPYPGDPRAVSRGSVTITGASPTTVPVDPNGGFSVRLMPGSYTITGTSPDYLGGEGVCEAIRPVRVIDGQGATVDVYCQLR